MKSNLTFLLALFLILFVAHCVDSDPEVKKNTVDGLGLEEKPTLNPKITSNDKTSSTLETKRAEPVEKAKVSNVNLEKKQNGVEDNSKSVPVKPVTDKETGNMNTGSKDKVSVDDVKKKNKDDKVSGIKNVPKEDSLSLGRKGSFRGELCDSSFQCTIDDGASHEMIACLNVPGDESTDVSLLIQNKGKGVLVVDINAPDFVRLDKNKIQIQENDDHKVVVSIGDGKTENLITLKTNKGSCSLNFMDFLTRNPMKKSNHTPKLTYTNLFRRTPFLGLVSLAFVLVLVSVLVCVTYQRRRFLNNGTKYQKLDAELPVSGGPKIDYNQKDDWDDNWGDVWDDVEAPSTPSMPLTPSISSAGVSSRRVNKDAWKD